MKVDSPDIDRQALGRVIEEQYGLCAVELRFVPGGEESYGYVLETSAQSRYFAKVYEHPPELGVRYKAANKLHTQCGLDFVVHPYATRHGEFHADLGQYAVAVFDLIDGTVSDRSAFSDEEWQQAARLAARLHRSLHCPALPSLPEEGFEIWFEDWLSSVLSATGDSRPLDSECEREARALLARERDDILIALEELKQLAGRAQAIPFERALTHGDLTPENLIKDHDGGLHLIDWGKVAIAPPERDLVNWIGERFEPFLEAYVGSYDRVPRLYPELFAFFRTFLVLWGITDYGSWILLKDADPVEKQHAWTALQQRLPIKHEQIEEDGVGEAIRRVTGGS
ncbi:MAG TPA: aminoglycoside phosphotransferase family protein [Anaerolineae bacterium]|nr:aminoglycoside phosphotransferase family protein [Anaerolineae bacterium]